MGINSKYCQELYDKEMKSKKKNGFIHPKFEDLTANKMKKEKQNEEKREKRRKERRAEIKADLEEKKKQKQIIEEKKAKREEERKKLREIKQKERAKIESLRKQNEKLQSELGKEAADLAQNAMNAMESHILSGSPLPDKHIKKRQVNKKKDKVPINSKYCQELYDKEMKSKKKNGFIH